MSKVKQWAEETAEKAVDKIIFMLKDGQNTFMLMKLYIEMYQKNLEQGLLIKKQR